MALSAIFVILYLFATTLVGALAARGGPQGPGGPDPEGPDRRREYVLGGSKTGPLLLFATMAATNFSAFTVFGLSGAGYRLGWAYYPAMGFGTGLMAVSFLLLGVPLRRLAAERGYVSPADFVRDRYESPALAKAFSGVLVLVTLPYLATQAIAGGRMLETLMGIPYPLASFLLVAVTAFYTFRGGFKAVAWTDLLQLVVLFAGAGLAFAAVLGLAGGLPAAAARLSAVSPAHLARVGAGAGVDLGALLGLWLLWALADPLFPQLFQRFYTAKDDASLKRAAMLYPLVCGGLFFLTVGVGVVGAALLPGLVGKETEQVFSRLALAAGSPAAGAVFALAAVAALMSTMDSQLLTLSSMIVEDFLPKRLKARRLDSLFVALLALAAWLISLAPPALILDWLTGAAFPAYAALAPVVWVGLYGRKTGAAAIAASCALGLILVVLEATKLLSFGPLPA
ncbi:MAG: sodium:solute symporter family protein, partial [Spirochaetaceae bacterium]|nr:sodium:solute symporter family protein [Spirochaetaceae bacterium]